MIVNKNLHFPISKNRPYFFSNFVTTIDGKAVVLKKDGYLPIGSKNDYDTFIDLRTYADALIHGKTTAVLHRTVDTTAQKPFLIKRKNRGKSSFLPYFILTNHPDKTLLGPLRNNLQEKPYIVTNKQSQVPPEIASLSHILRFGKTHLDLSEFSQYLFQKGYNHVLIEGGPKVFGSFLEKTLIDELFLTISPKIFGGYSNDFLTIVEGKLYKPTNINEWKLVSIKQMGNEVFLRYRIKSN